MVNSNRPKAIGFIKNTNNKDNYLNIGLLILRRKFLKIIELPVLTTREKLKKEVAREWKN